METLISCRFRKAALRKTSDTGTTGLQDKIIAYYKDAGPDYEYWSRNFNMHFGYGTLRDFFNRERMLEAMNGKVLDGLMLTKERNKVLDMGCGLGATLRHAALMHPDAILTGITIVPWQIDKGRELNERAGYGAKINLVEGDYTKMDFEDGTFNGVYAIESACHAAGSSKETFIGEMSRVLKTGGRFSIADGFVKNPHLSFDPVTKKCYQVICDNWALSSMAEIGVFKACLEKHGFKNIEVKDLSWKVAASVLHSPYVILSFLLKKMMAREKIQPQSISNLKGSLMSLLLGLNRRKFGYYLITGTKG